MIAIVQLVCKMIKKFVSFRSVKVLSVMFELARTSTSFTLQLVQMNAMKLLNFLLGKVNMLCRTLCHVFGLHIIFVAASVQGVIPL